METRVAVISIIVSNNENVPKLNDILHEVAPYIIGRMGIPYRERGISIISVALDAPQDLTSSVSGRIGRLPGIHTKTTYSDIITKH
ncbi:MAG: iron-only hydrogenase system regulator [Oscillospiraceae bacterium]|jgi:putative iron-only hydrogenase system regulator|nr:iron-only hydrogenase system regulator [Oscillospiraceae bacterium]